MTPDEQPRVTDAIVRRIVEAVRKELANADNVEDALMFARALATYEALEQDRKRHE